MTFSARKTRFCSLLTITLLLCAGCVSKSKTGACQIPPNGRYTNLSPYQKKGLWDVIKWRYNRHAPQWPEQVTNKTSTQPASTHSTPGQVAVTFINHATVLIQVDGINILTDPIWSERASPVSWAGPKRVRKAGLSLKKLPQIDVVLISHDHYDHLDKNTLKALKKRFHPWFLVGCGNETLLNQLGIQRVKPLAWWQGVTYKKHKITFVPAQHFSGRGLFDHMTTLWGGFVIQTSAGPIYFAGDTAWGQHFKQIRQRFGPIFLSLLPIGTYLPRDFMHSTHINPTEAVKAFEQLNSTYAIGIHFDTFANLADEGFGEAPKALRAALRKAAIPPERFLALEFGEGHVFTNKKR